jgi:PASTA domain
MTRGLSSESSSAPGPTGCTTGGSSPVVRSRSLPPGHDKAAAAVAAIKAAGLTAVTLPPTDNCADAGTVVSQNPPGGTEVAPGSQVDIQVATCIQ